MLRAPIHRACCDGWETRIFTFRTPKTKTPETEVSGVSMAVNSQVAWTKHRPVQPSNEGPGCPGSPIFKLCRRWSLELPRVSHLSATL